MSYITYNISIISNDNFLFLLSKKNNRFLGI